MKIKSEFALRKAIHNWMVLPLGIKNTQFTSVLTLNETGAMLWKHLEVGCDQSILVQALLDEYDVSRERAQTDVEEFIGKLQQIGCLEDERDGAL